MGPGGGQIFRKSLCNFWKFMSLPKEQSMRPFAVVLILVEFILAKKIKKEGGAHPQVTSSAIFPNVATTLGKQVYLRICMLPNPASYLPMPVPPIIYLLFITCAHQIPQGKMPICRVHLIFPLKQFKVRLLEREGFHSWPIRNETHHFKSLGCIGILVPFLKLWLNFTPIGFSFSSCGPLMDRW